MIKLSHSANRTFGQTTAISMKLAAVAIAALVSSPASAALVAYEGFGGSGSIAGQNGGTGWTSAWLNDNGAFSDFTTQGGLSYPGLSVSGGSATATTGAGGADARLLPSQNTGTVWVSFLGNFVNNSGGTDQFRLIETGVGHSLAVGGNDGYANWYLLDGTLSPPNGIDTGIRIGTGTHFALLRIDHAAQTTTLWMDPVLSGFSGTGGFTKNAFAPNFNKVALYGRLNSQFDEIRVGTSALDVGILSTVPEPTSLTLFGLGLAGLLRLKRR